MLKEWVFPDGDRMQPETTDYGNAILRFASGLSLALQASWTLPVHDGFVLDVYGSKGRLLATSPTFPTARDCRLEGGQLGGQLEPLAIGPGFLSHPDLALDWQAEVQSSYPMALSMRAMVVAVRGEALAAPDFTRAFEVERIQEAVRRSSAARCWIALADVE